jgi:hypothetical protein
MIAHVFDIAKPLRPGTGRGPTKFLRLGKDRGSRSGSGFLRFCLLLLVAISNSASHGQVSKTPSVSENALLLIEAHCVQCHGGEKTKGGLDLTARESLLRGGESGAAVVPGEPGQSLLYSQIAHQKEPGMPFKREKLPAEALVLFAEWIKAGVPYDRPVKTEAAAVANSSAAGFAISDADRNHWAFQPLKRIEPPAIKNRSWVQTPVDRFVLAALEAKGIAPAPGAAREQLIRRVTFDLIGLPPTPPEIDAFVKDDSSGAYERLVDRLLASPHYGERWGRHWLDLARFAESDGFEHDAARPNAWRYRDYVIKSFNEDKPYDRFIKEQIAGDELYPGNNEALVATAFNLLGPDMVDSADQVQRRHNTLNDMTDTVGLAFLGMTIGCARCHDHKFEPISQRDYYRLQAFFTPAAFRNDVPIPTPEERASYERAMNAFQAATQGQQKEITELEAPYRQKLYNEKLAKLSEEAQRALQTPKDERTPEQINQIQETADLLKITDKELLSALTATDRARHRKLQDEMKKIAKPAALPAAMALQSGKGARSKTFVLFRGEPTKPGEEVEAGYPFVLTVGRSSQRAVAAASPEEKPHHASTGASPYRSALAGWIASSENPLTARVMVNRIWQHHFGRGIVPTSSDFGTHGQRPTHPAMLDWLANEFMAGGWSIKKMHKLLLLSATYQQSSLTSREALTHDPENALFSRWQRKRLEGEVIRDSLLAISGQLNPSMGGPGVFPPIPSDVFKGASGWTTGVNPRDHVRRSLYIFARRNLKFPFLEVFDAPDSNLSCSGREQSTSAPQSLTLLNADEVMAASRAAAHRFTAGADSTDDRIVLAYRMILGRAPSPEDLNHSRSFLARSPYSELCRALINLNAFVYVE